MPLRKDYECLDCPCPNYVFEYSKEQGSGEFPEHPPCPLCGGTNTKSSFRNIKTQKVGITIPVYMRAGK